MAPRDPTIPLHIDTVVGVSKKELAHQILDIRDTLWLRSGDDYWQALYRLKALACQLSELVLQQKD